MGIAGGAQQHARQVLAGQPVGEAFVPPRIGIIQLVKAEHGRQQAA